MLDTIMILRSYHFDSPSELLKKLCERSSNPPLFLKMYNLAFSHR